MISCLTGQICDQQLHDLQKIFKGAKIALYNDTPKTSIFEVNADYSIGKTTIKSLKQIKATITFVASTNDGLRLLIEVRV